MTTIRETVSHMDWKLLREQKRLLVTLCEEIHLEVERVVTEGHGRIELLTGVISLIDALQDAAVEERVVTEEQVFALPEDV